MFSLKKKGTSKAFEHQESQRAERGRTVPRAPADQYG